jgi:rare lipoprotein A
MKYAATAIAAALFGTLAVTMPARAQGFMCEEQYHLSEDDMSCYRQGPDVPPIPRIVAVPEPPPTPDPLAIRLLNYAKVALRHRLNGLASYYSTSLNGTLTANGEHYYNRQLSAAHLTLPLGSWVEVKSMATGRKIRLRVNDRGPYVNKFVIDLSQAAARAIGVDMAADRRVKIRLIALPGETPLPDEALDGPQPAIAEETDVADR